MERTETLEQPESVERTATRCSLDAVVSWSRGVLTTESGDELPAWVLKHGNRIILCAVSKTPIIEAVSKPDRKLIAEGIACQLPANAPGERRGEQPKT